MKLTQMLKLFTKWISHFNFIFAGLLLLLFFINYFYLGEKILTVHDTYVNFQNYYIFYNEFFFNQDLVHWYPYGTYGLQSDYNQLISLTPMNYLFGIIGYVLKIHNVLFLFKLSIIGEQVVYLFGIYLLARRIFSSKTTVILICLAAIGSTIWYAQIWFNFRFYYMLPLVLYFLVSFFYENKPEYLWLTGISGLAWSVGNVPYFLPMWGFILLIIVVVLTIERSHVWRGLLKFSWSNISTFIVFILLACVYLYFTLHSLDYTILRAPGRDPITGKVTLETFRTYGGTADLYIVLQSFIAGWPLELPWGSGADNSVYIGLLPIVFLGIALVKEKNKLFLGLMGGIIVLIWLSIGGLFTSALYFVPLMSNYRHVGLVYGLTKVLVLIAAGFGMDHFLSEKSRKIPSGLIPVVIFIFLLESLLAMPGFFDRVKDGDWAAFWRSLFLARVWVYIVLVGLGLAYKKTVGFALVLGLLFDMFTFQFIVYQHRVPKLPDPYTFMLDTVQVNELKYQEQRSTQLAIITELDNDAESHRKIRALNLTKYPGAMAIYWETYDFAQLDPCVTEFRADFWSEGVDRLIQFERTKSNNFNAIKGCGFAKLRLYANALFVGSVDDVKSAIRNLSNQEQEQVVVIRNSNGMQQPASQVNIDAEVGEVNVTSFTLNNVVVDTQVIPENGAWLVYADAFHPGWKATVNGVEAPIEEAFLAFKAIWLPEGHNVVKFEFRNGLNYYLSYIIALFGVVFSIIICVLLLKTLFSMPVRDKENE